MQSIPAPRLPRRFRPGTLALCALIFAAGVHGVASPSASPSQVLYVAAGGSDSGSCSVAAPCGTLARAFSAAQPGASVVVQAGLVPRPGHPAEHEGFDATRHRLGTAARRFANLDIFGSHVEIRDVTTDGWYVKPGATDVVLRRVISTSPVFVTAASNVRVFGGQVYSKDPYVHNGSQLKEDSGVPPRNVLFDGVSFHDFRKDPASSDHVDCLHILAGNGVIVRNSRFWNCEHFDILFTQFGSAGSPTNVLIENNFLSCCGSGYYSLQLGGGHGEVWKNITVRYNSADKALNVDSANSIGGGIAFIANVAPHMPTGICGRRGITVDYNVFAERPTLRPARPHRRERLRRTTGVQLPSTEERSRNRRRRSEVETRARHRRTEASGERGSRSQAPTRRRSRRRSARRAQARYGEQPSGSSSGRTPARGESPRPGKGASAPSR